MTGTLMAKQLRFLVPFKLRSIQTQLINYSLNFESFFFFFFKFSFVYSNYISEQNVGRSQFLWKKKVSKVLQTLLTKPLFILSYPLHFSETKSRQ